jgi:L-ascorbate metabolism protein UlaG (beta-lactamase superfamily)
VFVLRTTVGYAWRRIVEEMLGGTRINYLGHSTFRLVTAGGEQILIDPFLTDNPLTPDELKQAGGVDTILVTHGHFDHFADVVPIAQDTGATVVANFEIFSYLQGQGIEHAMPIQKGGTAEVGSIKVTAVNAFHSSSIQTPDGTTIYGGEPLGYVVEFESGFRLYHAGDTCVFGDMQLIGELYRPELALLPIGNQVVMSPFEAAHAARLLGVRHVVPIHYGTFPFVPGTPEEFQKQVGAIAPGVTVHVMNPGDDLSS